MAVEQVGWVTAPNVGVDGVSGCVLIIAFPDDNEIQPVELVTVKLYVVPDVKPETVVLVPLPVIRPGLIVHIPAAGNPFNTTLPVEVEQSG